MQNYTEENPWIKWPCSRIGWNPGLPFPDAVLPTLFPSPLALHSSLPLSLAVSDCSDWSLVLVDVEVGLFWGQEAGCTEVGEEQGSSRLGAALHLQPESQDQIPLCWAQASSPLIGLLLHYLFLPHLLPGYQGPGTLVLCPLFISIFVLWGFYPQRLQDPWAGVQPGRWALLKLPWWFWCPGGAEKLYCGGVVFFYEDPSGC